MARCFHALGKSQEALDALRQNLKKHQSVRLLFREIIESNAFRLRNFDSGREQE